MTMTTSDTVTPLIAERPSQLAMEIAGHMEVHAALSTTTEAKAREIDRLLSADKLVLRSAGTPSVGEGEVDLSRDFFKMTPSQLRAAIEAEPDGMEADAGRLHPEATPSEPVTISPEEVTIDAALIERFQEAYMQAGEKRNWHPTCPDDEASHEILTATLQQVKR